MTEKKIGTIEFGLERLEALADLLDQIEDHQFGYGSWVGGDWEGRDDFSCGTTACALGWATTIEKDLSMNRDDQCVHLDKSVGADWYDDEFKGTDAASIYYGITSQEAHQLFVPQVMCEDWLGYEVDVRGMDSLWSPRNDASRDEVADHIRKFVNYKRKQLTSDEDGV